MQLKFQYLAAKQEIKTMSVNGAWVQWKVNDVNSS